MKNESLILNIVAMLIKSDSADTRAVHPALNDGSGYPVAINEPIRQYEQAAVGAAMMGDDLYEPQAADPQPPPSLPGFDRDHINAPYSMPVGAAWVSDAPPQGAVVKLASPDLGTAIPMDWLDPVDTLYDTLKDNAGAVASLDAMIMNWLKIKRYEPKAGDKFVSSNDQTVGGEIGFIIERLIKRGYEYVGTASGSGCYGHYYGRGYGKMRRAVVKLENGLTPPQESPLPIEVPVDGTPSFQPTQVV